MALNTSARPPTSATPLVRPSEKADIRAVLEEHRLARLDQIKAWAFADPRDGGLDPGPRLRAVAVAELALLEIDRALLRLDDGSYGFCVGCAEPIPQERLLAVPYASYCVPCV